MSDPRINLKNQWLAAVLAYLIPGAGHLYQQRYFKGFLYFLCIVPAFFFGMHLGDWKITYWFRDPTNILNPYYAQFWVGLPSLPAMVQSRRYRAPENTLNSPNQGTLSENFTGNLQGYRDTDGQLLEGEVNGQITLEPIGSPVGHYRGSFQGTLLTDAQESIEVDVPLGGRPEIEKPIAAGDRRILNCFVVTEDATGIDENGTLFGSIPRSFWDRYQVPLDELQIQALHGKLGKYHELAQIFTMIAGLLNILAIWDAFQGPAYGYGDRQLRREEKEQTATPQSADDQSKSNTVKPPSAGTNGEGNGTTASQPATAKSSMA